MNKDKFLQDFKTFQACVLQSKSYKEMLYIMHGFCMGYCQFSNEFTEDFSDYIDLDPVFDKINEIKKEILDIENQSITRTNK